MLNIRTRVAATAVVVAVGAVMGAGIASANVPVDKTLTFRGDFPVIGELKDIRGQIVTSLPSPVKVGQSGTVPFTLNVDAPPDAGDGLNLIGAASLEGFVDADIVLTDSAGTVATVHVHLPVPSTPTPPPGERLKFTASGDVAFPAGHHAGAATVKLNPSTAATTLTPKDSAGNNTALGTFTVDLTLDPPDQDTTLGTVQVTE